MTCQEFEEWMHLELDGELGQKEADVLHGHMSACGTCRTLYERLRRVSDELERLPEVAPPYSIVDRILPRLEFDLRRKRQKSGWMPRVSAFSGVAAAFALVIALAVEGYISSGQTPAEHTDIFLTIQNEEKGTPPVLTSPVQDGSGTGRLEGAGRAQPDEIRHFAFMEVIESVSTEDGKYVAEVVRDGPFMYIEVRNETGEIVAATEPVEAVHVTDLTWKAAPDYTLVYTVVGLTERKQYSIRVDAAE